MLEERLPGEVLVIGVLNPAGDHRLVRKPVSVLKVKQRRQLHQLMPRIDQVDQTRTQQVILFLRARAVLHG